MDITIASFKGGVGKTTTAVHLAAYLASRGPALLIDGDPNRSASAWASRGNGALPFKVADERQGHRFARDAEHVVYDTKARPEEADLKALASGCDLLVIPTTPDALSLDALMQTILALEKIGADNYRVLLTIVPPRPNRDADEARDMLKVQDVKLFKGQIRRFAAFQKAALAGGLVKDIHEPRAVEGWTDYEAIGREVLK